MLDYLKQQANITQTENGAVSYKSTHSYCLDLFASIGAVRRCDEKYIIAAFEKAYAENPDIAMKILFFARDIRGGLGERRVFRIIINHLAKRNSCSIKKNIPYISEYGRFDDLMSLINTPCEDAVIDVIRTHLNHDTMSCNNVSLIAKWLPSVNASSENTKKLARHIARRLKLSDREYRIMLSELRHRIKIIENNLRVYDYTFDYSKIPSKALFKYKKAFIRNDNERYSKFLNDVMCQQTTMHTDTLMPYEIVRSCLESTDESEELSLDVMWNNLKDYASDENAIVVIDGSGSMYWNASEPLPATVALSLGIYFAERNKGHFKNHFITFSCSPQLVEIKGNTIAEKVRYCEQFNECANTDIDKVFSLILNTAIIYNLPPEELPKRLYIVSDMEFDICAENAEASNFENARKEFEENGYTLPEVIFWNVAFRRSHYPVRKNEQGVALVSGCTPEIFEMATDQITDPYDFMIKTVTAERYAPISA